MRIQSIDTGMINKTYQKNNQTMPMAKTNNTNSSPVVDNNITYTIYGKNSSGTVAFAGLPQELKSRLLESFKGTNFSKDCLENIQRLFQATSKDKTSESTSENLAKELIYLADHWHLNDPRKVRLESFIELLSLTFKDETPVITSKNALDVLRESIYPETVTYFKKLLPLTSSDGTYVITSENVTPALHALRTNRFSVSDDLCEYTKIEHVIENLPELLKSTFIDKTPVITSKNIIRVFEQLRHSGPTQIVTENFTKLLPLTYKDKTPVITSENAPDVIREIGEMALGGGTNMGEVVKAFTKLLPLTYKDKTPVVTSENLLGVLWGCSKSYAKGFTELLPLTFIDKTPVVTSKNLVRTLCACSESRAKGFTELLPLTYKDKTPVVTSENCIDILEYSEKSKVECFKKLFTSTDTDKNPVITSENGIGVLKFFRYDNAEKAVNAYTKLLPLTYKDKNPVITSENTYDVISTLTFFNYPEHLVDLYIKLHSSTFFDGTAVIRRKDVANVLDNLTWLLT